jgi:hypothetical protein
MTGRDARRLALALPGVEERDHHGFPGFRAGPRGRILATLPTDEVLRIMLEESAVREAAAEWPWCTEGHWGRRVTHVEVALDRAEADVVAELLAEAHARATV